jgi:hypothetical protein
MPLYKEICCASKLFDTLKQFNPSNSYVAVSPCLEHTKGKVLVAAMVYDTAYGRVFNLDWNTATEFCESNIQTPKLEHNGTHFFTEDGRKFEIVDKKRFINVLFAWGIAQPQDLPRACEKCSTVDLVDSDSDSDSEQEEQEIENKDHYPNDLHLQPYVNERNSELGEAKFKVSLMSRDDVDELFDKVPDEPAKAERKQKKIRKQKRANEAEGAPANKRSRSDSDGEDS